MFLLMSFPLQVNLLPLTKALWAQNIAHQVLEKGDEQQLWLMQAGHAPKALELCQALNHGELEQLAQVEKVSRASISPVSFLLSAPLTAGVLLITMIIAVITGLGDELNYIALLSFYQINLLPEPHLLTSSGHLASEPWRLLTPVWLHFGWLHLVFNSLWWWDLGRRIEQRQSVGRLVLLFLVIGLVSNLAQAWEGAHLFGGLSGVIYGLLGYIWLWDRLRNPVFFLPQGILIFMLIWLILGLTNAFSAVGFGNMANMAHLGGLLTGLGMALVLSVVESLASKTKGLK